MKACELLYAKIQTRSQVERSDEDGYGDGAAKYLNKRDKLEIKKAVYEFNEGKPAYKLVEALEGNG